MQFNLEKYFFPVQDVRANPEHNPNSDMAVNHVNVAVNFNKSEAKDNLFAIEVTISTDSEASENPAYFLEVIVFGLFIISSEEEGKEEEIKNFALTSGAQMLIGAARERIASLTTRGPWPQILLHTIGLPEINTIAD